MLGGIIKPKQRNPAPSWSKRNRSNLFPKFPLKSHIAQIESHHTQPARTKRKTIHIKERRIPPNLTRVWQNEKGIPGSNRGTKPQSTMLEIRSCLIIGAVREGHKGKAWAP